MESQLPYNNMNTFPAEADQRRAAPTVVVASTSSQTRYKNYSSRLNVTLGVIQIVCGVLLMGLNVSKFKTILSMNDSQLKSNDILIFFASQNMQSQQSMHAFQIVLIALESPLGNVSDGTWCGVIVSSTINTG